MNAALAVGGVVPRAIAEPRDQAELADVVRAQYARGAAFAFVGGGTQLTLGNPPTALDTVIRTNALDRVVDYTPEDQTITVEGGMTLAALDRILAEQRQMLPLDAVDRERATLGGLVAANTYGRLRHRYGTFKDVIVGVGMVRPDGTPVRGGGKVVKNVAGFDLPKLAVGSLGTLGAIATVTLRVYPAPDAHGTVAGAYADDDGFTARDVAAVADAIVRARLEPSALWAVGRADGRYRMVAAFAGSQAAVDAQATACAQLFAERGVAAERRDGTDDGAAETAQRFGPAPRIRVGFAPASFAAIDDLIRPLIDDATGVLVYPGIGIAFVQPSASVDYRALLIALRRREGLTAVVEAMPDAWYGTVDAWGDPPRALRVMQSLKHSFDPRGLCNPGRYVGGL